MGVVTFASITDGLSNTAMFSEWVRGKNNITSGGVHQIYKESLSATGTGYVPLINYLNSCKTTKTISSGQKGMRWFNHSCSQGGGYSHIMTPNLNACEWANTGGGQYRTIVGASSYHPGGVNVCFIDGSVHFIKNGVSQQAWWGIATKSGGEIISAIVYERGRPCHDPSHLNATNSFRIPPSPTRVKGREIRGVLTTTCPGGLTPIRLLAQTHASIRPWPP